ncbi:MAG: tripartite tricarboxylate transporter TctB family protein [Treponema sp.]|jgi:hypothetical protein|nr:tripartite tricarboxylate transporter TctB family protein [Treponema sp.]
MKRFLNAEVIFGDISALVALLFIAKARTFQNGSADGVPGPGYFPIFAASLLLLFSVLLIVSGVHKQTVYFQLDVSQKENLITVLLVFADLICFFILWYFIPFIIAAIVFQIILGRILKCSWKFTIIYAFTSVIVLYLLFHTAFKVKLNIN